VPGIETQSSEIANPPRRAIDESLADCTTACANQTPAGAGDDGLFRFTGQTSVGEIVRLAFQRKRNFARHRIVTEQAAEVCVVSLAGDGEVRPTSAHNGQFAFKNGPCHDSSPRG